MIAIIPYSSVFARLCRLFELASLKNNGIIKVILYAPADK